jgi:homoserine kinase
LELANEIEGHPDNVAPAIYGGVQLCLAMDSELQVRNLPCPQARVIIFLPSRESRCSLTSTNDKTTAMRGLLPKEVNMKDAVFNLSRVAMLVDVLHKKDWSGLCKATEDKLHQPIRSECKFPYLNDMIKAALSGGAHCAFLSGAGPSVLSMRCEEEEGGEGGETEGGAVRNVEKVEEDIIGLMKEVLR